MSVETSNDRVVFSRAYIVEEIIRIIKQDVLLDEEADVQPFHTLSEAGLDSLDGLEMLHKIEQQFAVSISNVEAKSLITISDVASLIYGKIDATAKAANPS